MALLADTGEDYTKTGKGMLGRWSSKLSFLPPIFRSGIVAFLGFADTAIESVGLLFRGQIGSALTAAAAGSVATTVNAFTDTMGGFTWWAGNLASGGLTGESLGTHARAATEGVIGAVTGALGVKPTILSSYPAAVGSIGSSAVPQGPGKFATGVSAQRGEDANAAYARYQRGEGGAHINELQSAYGRSA